MGENKDKIVGRIKQAAGGLTDDEDLEEEGEAQEIAGRTKELIGDAADKLDETVDQVRDELD
jgi:uncharacterized protein YjbJ (UPF0337 family)